MHQPFEFQFEWDPVKARQNTKKHRISFERATTVFLDPQALSGYDEEHSGREVRWVTLGIDQTGTLVVVCHTYNEETSSSARIRIISARKATRAEANHYGRR